jgi:hypothetical protein
MLKAQNSLQEKFWKRRYGPWWSSVGDKGWNAEQPEACPLPHGLKPVFIEVAYLISRDK